MAAAFLRNVARQSRRETDAKTVLELNRGIPDLLGNFSTTFNHWKNSMTALGRESRR
jgi:hypothetical protein